MTKLISIFILVVVVFCGWQLFKYWEQVQNEEENKKKAEAAQMNPANLQGMPTGQLEQSYQQALQHGNAAIRTWLKTYGDAIQDPRKAWIELDFAVAITREDPTEARKIFKAVKDRTPASSPILPRIKQLEKTYE